MKRYWAVLWFLAASAVNAEQMSFEGASPDSGLKGVWRIIAAQPAPWTKAFPITRKTAPLLEYAIVFDEGAVKGPPGLSCDHAVYYSGVSEYFGGKLLPDTTDTLAKAVHLTRNTGSTGRTVCGTTVHDYYFDDDANLAVLEGDIVYTLRRPDGMDVDKIQPGYSGPGFDCTQVRTQGEKLLCSEANLAAADRKLNQAYERLKHTETAESFATVQSAQRGWLVHVLTACHANGKPDDDSDDFNIKECLRDNYEDRAQGLDGLAAMKSGELILEPRMRFHSRLKPPVEDSDIYPWIVGDDAFNAFVAKKLALDRRRTDQDSRFQFGDEDYGNQTFHARRSYHVERFDDHVASLAINMFDYSGVRETFDQEIINWDMRHARAFTMADVFRQNKAWEEFVIDYCLAEVADVNGDDVPLDREHLRSVVKDKYWRFGPDKAMLYVPYSEYGGISGPGQDVAIPYAKLKPYLKADAPVL